MGEGGREGWEREGGMGRRKEGRRCDSHVMQVEAEKYAVGVKWLKEILYSVQFTKERLLVVARKMINDVSRLEL